MNRFKPGKTICINGGYRSYVSIILRSNIVFIVTLVFITSTDTKAQVKESFSIKGTVSKTWSLQPVPGAVISVKGSKSINTVTDTSGTFELSLPAGNYIFEVSVIGYINKSVNISIEKNTSTNILIESNATTLKEVIVNSSTDNTLKVLSTQPGVETVDKNTALLIPAILGEVDIIKVLQLKPGVKNIGEGSSGISVRGGGTDQNLFLLDGSTVYNPSHLFGFFSTFNIDAIKDVQLYKSGFPAEFSGRLSSIVDVHTSKGTDSALSVSGGIGLISSRLNLQGNLLKKNKRGQTLTFNIAGRRTYADVFIRGLNEAHKDDTTYNAIPDYYFYDMNARIDFRVSDKDLVYASFYYGRDHAKFDLVNFNSVFGWGNITAGIHWKHNYSKHLYSETSVHLSDYNYSLQSKFDRFEFKLGSGISDYSISQKFAYDGFTHHQIKFGAEAALNQFQISRFNINSTQPDENFDGGEDISSKEAGIYISDEYEINNKFSINAGIRFNAYHNERMYTGLEPRINARYLFNDDFSIKASYSRMQQYKHLVTSSGASLPTDIWYPSTSKIKPEVSDLVSIASSWSFDNKFLLTWETYYKWMRKLVDNKPGSSLFVNVLENEFVFGKGNSYGNEISLEKTFGKLRGWMGYTLAWTTRQFKEINNNKKFFPRMDRRHEFSIVANYPFSKNLSFSGSWTYYTGNMVSVPTGRYFGTDVPGTLEEDAIFFLAPVFPVRGNYRMPDYHRLDLGVILRFNPRHGSANLTFSAYNAYSRLNVYFISFEAKNNNSLAEGNPAGYTPKAVTLFPIIPSITYNFKF